MAEINDLNVTDASNTGRFPEGQAPSTVNNGARALEGLVARWHKDINCTVTASGTNTYTATINADTGFALYDGYMIGIDFTNANTSMTCTLNLTPDGGAALGAKAIVLMDGTRTPFVGQINGFHMLRCDGTNFRLMNPHQVRPAFLAYLSASATDQTGNGTVYTVAFDTEVFDTGGNFASNTFTAPVTGKYFLTAQVQLSGITAAADTVTLGMITTNRTYQRQYQNTNDIGENEPIVVSAVADMDASETAVIRITVAGEASDVVDVVGGSTLQTFFSGHFVSY